MLSTVGIMGAGVMGRGVALDLVNHQIQVILYDSSAEQLQRCRDQISTDTRLYRVLGVNGVPDPGARIRFCTDLKSFGQADLLIECVTESVHAKQQAFRAADRFCRPEVTIASNTSAIPIRKLATFANRPGQVLGLHFMNPVPLQKTVEMIRGPETSSESIEHAQTLCDRIGKSVILVNDGPGFVSNRVTMLAVNEAATLHGEGVASVEETDRIFTQCLHHRMGPLATADLIGLDTVVLTLQVLQEEIDSRKYAPARVLTDLVSAGKLGRKTGEGFYRYDVD